MLPPALMVLFSLWPSIASEWKRMEKQMLSKCMILSLRSRQLGRSLVIVELIHHIVLLISMGYMHTTAPPPASFNSKIFSILFRFEDKDKRGCWRRWKSMMTRTLGMPQKRKQSCSFLDIVQKGVESNPCCEWEAVGLSVKMAQSWFWSWWWPGQRHEDDNEEYCC